jgi:hypothetical protein
MSLSSMTAVGLHSARQIGAIVDWLTSPANAAREMDQSPKFALLLRDAQEKDPAATVAMCSLANGLNARG